MNNPYKGTSDVCVNGQTLTLCYDWDALSRVQSELGQEGQMKALSGDPLSLSILLAIGLARHQPEWTVDRVRRDSPPVIPTIKAIEMALTAAIFGSDGVPKEKSEEVNPPQPPQTRLNRLWRRLFAQE